MRITTRKINVLSIAALAVAAIAVAPTQAATITTADGNGADSMVRQDGNSDANNPALMDDNFGADGRIWARSASSKKRFDAIFLRFDISDYVSGSFTGTPTLGLTKYRDDDTGTDLIVYGLNESVDTWVEGGLTYNNAPGITPETPANGDNDVNLTEVSVLVTDAEGFELTGNEGDAITVSDSDFLTFLNDDTDGLVTFIIARKDDNSGIDDIATKETTTLGSGATITLGSGAPTLTFEGTLIPEPASLALLGLGGLMMLPRGRRRR